MELPADHLSRAHPARVWNYLLGGKDNYAADREAAEAVIKEVPAWPAMARANRDFLRRVVHHLVSELKVRQFIDLGCGLPTDYNVHQIALRLDPTSRVVYVDNDPIVAAHARALLVDDADGRTAFVAGDLTQPRELLDNDELRAALDFSQPVALILASVLVYFDNSTVRHILATMLSDLPVGSFLVISHLTADFGGDAMVRGVTAAKRAGLSCMPRTKTDIESMFDGLELLVPGVVPMLAWRPYAQDIAGQASTRVFYWVGVGRYT